MEEETRRALDQLRGEIAAVRRGDTLRPTHEGFHMGPLRLFVKLVGSAFHVFQQAEDGEETDLTDAISLQGIPVSETDPTAAEVLAYNATTGKWQPTAAGAPGAHKTTHQDGGTDEISVAALSGLLADDQHVLDTEVDARVNALAVLLAGAQTVAGIKTFGDGIATDTIAEETATAGVTIDGSKVKDFFFYPDPAGHASMRIGWASPYFYFSYSGTNTILFNTGTSTWYVNVGGNSMMEINPTHISAVSHLISDLLDPVSAQDAATKNYVDITAVPKSLYDAYTILMATTDNTPVALTVAEQTLVGRITGGAIAALTAAQVRTLLDFVAQAIAAVKPVFLVDFGTEINGQTFTP